MVQVTVTGMLPEEAPDLTASELHEKVLVQLYSAVSYALRGQSLVLMEILLRVHGVKQVGIDLLVAPGAPGLRRVYKVPEEPVPLATLEVLSPANFEERGEQQLAEKRELIGLIGVPHHIEVDPYAGVVTTWTSTNGQLKRTSVGNVYDGPALGGVRIVASQPRELHVFEPGGREVLDPADEIARAEALAERLRELGVDPNSI